MVENLPPFMHAVDLLIASGARIKQDKAKEDREGERTGKRKAKKIFQPSVRLCQSKITELSRYILLFRGLSPRVNYTDREIAVC
jgi:hypothetical protein